MIKNNGKIPKFWLPCEYYAVYNKIDEPEECLPYAMEILCRMVEVMEKREDHTLHIVCGPISSCKNGNTPEGNLEIFQKSIAYVGLKTGQLVLNQLTFEKAFWRYYEKWSKENPGKYPVAILNEFYEPLFNFILKSKTIKIVSNFIPNWNDSYGAKWERVKFKALRDDYGDSLVKIEDFSPDWLEEFESLSQTAT